MPWQIILGLILGHIAVIFGCYLVTSGVNALLKTNAKRADILKQPLFWGLFAIMGGLCFFFAPQLSLLLAK